MKKTRSYNETPWMYRLATINIPNNMNLIYSQKIFSFCWMACNKHIPWARDEHERMYYWANSKCCLLQSKGFSMPECGSRRKKQPIECFRYQKMWRNKKKCTIDFCKWASSHRDRYETWRIEKAFNFKWIQINVENRCLTQITQQPPMEQSVEFSSSHLLSRVIGDLHSTLRKFLLTGWLFTFASMNLSLVKLEFRFYCWQLIIAAQAIPNSI